MNNNEKRGLKIVVQDNARTLEDEKVEIERLMHIFRARKGTGAYRHLTEQLQFTNTLLGMNYALLEKLRTH